jgi:hypothetical protein
MNIFLKIGLPWAVSLGVIFFIGLTLGSKVIVTNKELKEGADHPKSNFSSGLESEKKKTAKVIEEVDLEPFNSNHSPAMPPNLLRIMQGGDIVERLGSYLDAVRSMDKSNVKQVVKAFEELPKGYGRHLEMKLLMRSWASFDPEGALAYASTSLDAQSEKRFGISEALAGWAVLDYDAAVSWANANNPGKKEGDNPLLVGILKGLVETDLEAANRLFLSLPKGSAKWQSSAILADLFSEKGPPHAIAWVQNYPKDDPKLREAVLGQISSKLVQDNIEETSRWAQSMAMEPGALRVVDNIISHWASLNPQAASSWIDNLQNEDKKKHAMKQLSDRWASIDPVATAEWLNSQESSPMLDPAIAAFVLRIKEQDPEGATGWAQSITDQNLREESLKSAVNAWMHKDPEKAKTWVNQTK